MFGRIKNSQLSLETDSSLSKTKPFHNNLTWCINYLRNVKNMAQILFYTSKRGVINMLMTRSTTERYEEWRETHE